jgi:hypothetical protein
LGVVVTTVNAYTTTTTVTDDATGRVDIVVTLYDDPVLSLRVVLALTDYDLTNREAWTSYSETRSIRNQTPVLERVEALMDDGSRYRRDLSYYGLLDGTPIQHRDTVTLTAANGAVDYVYEAVLSFDFRAQPVRDYTSKASDYDPATGLLDYVITRYRDGRVEAIDHDPRTGNRDYAVTTRTDGSILAEDYDSAGRLDYVIEYRADGGRTATDYDLNDDFAWTTYTITYGASGDIIGTGTT